MSIFEYETLKVGEEVAIDTGHEHPRYLFAHVIRTTKQFVEVQMVMNSDKVKFSMATKKPLGQPSWNERYRLYSAERARQHLHMLAVQREIKAERNAIRTEMEALLQASWNKETADKLRALAVRVEVWVEST